MPNDIDLKHAVMLTVSLNETLCLTLQSYENGVGLTPEIVEKLRTIHNLANEMLGLEEHE